MNLSGPLLFLLLTASTVSGGEQISSFLELWNMIWCVQPGVNPLKYVDYGCNCGLFGQGTPVDELDQCCKIHDDCHAACLKNPECLPYVNMYDFTCTELQPTCSATNNKCQAAICECDRAAALCFAQAKYNPEYKYMDQKLCKK